ncbi:flagellar hook protein FlgE [Sphingomonas bacterium]|uniref:flagellar hook protein FlgE n=1 Tax=Sphingomonas bacterium TaxID=1895847 RepID=UPI001576BC67|nr:flagellar hook protein FlgE [Sphingomonas bacterium]
MTFYTSLSGLQAAQTDMSTISHNLANVATNGFKKSRTDFADVIASSLAVDPTKLVGSGVVVKGNVQQFAEGNLTTTSSSLDLAVSGDGFFAVKTSGTTPQLDYTRNGAFQVNANHFITDAQGSYLQAYPVDSEGNVTATGTDGLQNVQLPETSGSPVATSSVTLKVNLSSGSTAPTGSFDRSNASTYNNSTATTIYDANGNSETLTNYYVKGATDGSGNTSWSVHSFVGDEQLTSGGSPTTTLTFNNAGVMTSPTTATNFDTFQPSGSPTAQTISFDLSSSTQYSSAFAVASRTQNGKAAGELSGVSVDANGLITASFTNGDSKKLGVVALANFTNPAGLKQLGSSYWSSTGVSGGAIMGSANQASFGNLMTGTLEGSNVDITEELVDLIAAQRNFQANAKALDTASQISETIFNIRT